MRVGLVGHDVAPTQAFRRIQEALVSRDNDVVSFVADGKPFANSKEEIISSAKQADVILLGMSSSADLAKEEVAVAEMAAEIGIPFGFYADTYKCHRRPWFGHLREKANAVFVINENEAISARELFPNAKVVVSGNPEWEDFFSPKFSREEIRAKLEVADDQRMILCPGGKNLAVNMLHWGSVIEALAMAPVNEIWKVFLSVHPGDTNGADAYKDLVKWSKRVLVRVVTKDYLSASDMLPAADFVIESASTIAIEAACQRKPVISYFSEIALGRLEDGSGSRNYELCELGVTYQVNGSPEKLLSTIRDILLYGSGLAMERRQEQVYSKPPEKGAAVKMMIETLTELAHK
ncbi:MAG: hypothetical protein G01um10143_126 [Parcubacteria group bacterium Gr01-1014_3]|nr:MAG: hypothetical protein G01um10143_126 [Parcubacteria group bacterium Gr01-1014_3]